MCGFEIPLPSCSLRQRQLVPLCCVDNNSQILIWVKKLIIVTKLETRLWKNSLNRIDGNDHSLPS